MTEEFLRIISKDDKAYKDLEKIKKINEDYEDVILITREAFLNDPNLLKIFKEKINSFSQGKLIYLSKNTVSENNKFILEFI